MSDSSEDAETTLRLLQLLALLGAGDLPDARGASGGTTRSSKHYLSDYIMVAAIDFGTTFSGYAFSFKDKKNDIKMNKNWGASVGCTSYKTPTCVLLDPEKQFKSFGYDAQLEYAGMIEGEDQNFYYFEHFKMKLHNTKDLSKTTMITAANKKSLPALDIFSIALNYLKDHLLAAVNQSITGELDADMIRWVITVPAIWSDASKQFMREAALQAGLIKDLDSTKLVIALEPEAASLYVRKMDIHLFMERSTPGMSGLRIQPGTKYLVIDAGGGTLDVTVHELMPDHRVKELHFATGGALGGTRVDAQFVSLMEDIFGQDFISAYKTGNASQWLQIMSDFEKRKRSCNPDGKQPINVQLPWSFATQYNELKKENIDEPVKRYKGSGVIFANGTLSMKPEKVMELFEDVVNDIANHIQGLLQHPKVKGVKYFFCVGGFSESSILQEAIKQRFSNEVSLLVPEEASLAVVKGAIQFGHQPDCISSRISAKTYGVKTLSDFIPFLLDKSKGALLNGRVICTDIFQKFVSKGEEVPDNFCTSFDFSPIRVDQDGAEVQIYSSENERVKYITDADVEHHGKIFVKWPGTGLDRKLKITMTFGGTEIQVEAVSFPGENSADTKINFLTE